MAVCFIGFSTFYGKRFVNIHDLIVLPKYRNQGVAHRLLKAVEAKALRMDCCKLTLEVRVDNEKGMRLYERRGFSGGEYPMYFWTKML
jgi:ribosomal protein S18 acetylase RimI-like enzyme